jgi:hypothetical protein
VHNRSHTVTRTQFEIGRSGHDTGYYCSSLASVLIAGETLAPGSYWIRRRIGRRFVPVDWGTLEVRDRGDWCLRGPRGLQVGPSYAVV